MKKILSLVLALICVLVVTGCSQENIQKEKDNSIPEISTSTTDQTMVENDGFYLYDIISHNIQLVRVNGYGVTSSLNDSEIDDFLEIAKSIEFRLANDDNDITAPGAITISVVVDYTNGESQEVTLASSTSALLMSFRALAQCAI